MSERTMYFVACGPDCGALFDLKKDATLAATRRRRSGIENAFADEVSEFNDLFCEKPKVQKVTIVIED